MEFAQVLHVFWRRRGWVLLGLGLAIVIGLSTGYRIGLFPPSLHSKALAVGEADTQLLVDYPDTALGNVQATFDPLTARSTIFARVMTTTPVRQAIAAELGVSEAAISTEAPLSPGSAPQLVTEPTDLQRAHSILGENLGYRLRFVADSTAPTIDIQAQATDAQSAIRLANGAAVGFIKYMKGVEVRQGIPHVKRVALRQLGQAEGGLVGGGSNARLAVVVVFGVFLGWLVLLVFGSSIVDALRDMRASGRDDESSHPASA